MTAASQSSSSSSFITPTGSKTVTCSKNIHSKKHKTHNISYKSENKSSKISVYSIKTPLQCHEDLDDISSNSQDETTTSSFSSDILQLAVFAVVAPLRLL